MGSAYGLISVNSDAKTRKGEDAAGVRTGILYLAPHTVSGWNVCAHASEGCATACLFTAGRGAFDSVRNARIRRTELFFQESATFYDAIERDVERLVRSAERDGLTPAIRLNGTSDIPWERIERMREIMHAFSTVDWYDYTAYDYHLRPLTALPANYSLTYSLKETSESWDSMRRALMFGRSVAVVFSDYAGQDSMHIGNGRTLNVVNGDLHDYRPSDPAGSIVALKAKGKARSNDDDFDGFVNEFEVFAETCHRAL